MYLEIGKTMDIREFLKIDYELNEKYHDTKERVIWLAFGLYCAYSFGSIQFILSNENENFLLSKPDLFYVLIDMIILILALIFIFMQTKLKVISVFKKNALTKIMVDDSTEQIKNWFRNQSSIGKILLKENKNKIYLTCRIEIVLFTIMVVVFILKSYWLLTKGSIVFTVNQEVYIFIYSSFIYYIVSFLVFRDVFSD